MNPRILIAEDERKFCLLIEDYLQEKGGYTVVDVVHNGEEAIDSYMRHRPDLVMMDLLMPRMDGRDAIIEILERDPDARILVITARLTREFKREMADARAIAYLEKPFSLSDLVAAADGLLKRGKPLSSPISHHVSA